MFKLLPKCEYPTEILYFLTEHTYIIYVQFMVPREKLHLFKRNRSRMSQDISFLDSIFKRLTFDYSSSETVLNQQIKLRAIFLVTAYS